MAKFSLFRKTWDMKLREELLIHFIPLVKQVAGRMIVSLPRSVELSELESAGLMGLVNAIDRFDPAVGVKFETYAIPRIKGAILDGLRELGWAPRSIRAKSRILATALQKLSGELGRSPNDRELADYMDIDIDDYYRILDDASLVTLMSLDDSLTNKQGDTLSLADIVEDDETSRPYFGMERNEIKELTIEAIKSLSEQERLVIALYYYEELTLKEIGLVMEISESRVSQIHTKAILTMKAMLMSAVTNR
ncbi:MAG: FliA/WhiG family RNA polymerase sigma factor [FCB group bacterium]|nr:FliA/WhiG family RNA polymerase sigma factor [FCB group bacterium]